MNRLLLLALALLLSVTARADVFHLGHYTLLPGDAGAGSHELLVDVPVEVESARTVSLPDGCRQTGESRQIAADRARLSFRFACNRALARSDIIITPWPVDAASLRTPGSAAMAITPDAGGVTLPIGLNSAAPRRLPAVAGDYGRQGIVHILSGWDHLGFVLCLCLAARGRRLLLLVTLFTLGHSISLAGAFFEWISVPMPPVEAAIALSILFMAREALVGTTASVQRQALVTGSFGLLHGLGFAAALGELGVPAGERLPALLFFNLGVEAGQLLFVVAVLAVLAATGKASAPLRTAALYATGAMSSFWLLERLAGFAQAG